MKARRIFLVILDSLGIGELPDADDFGDRGANTIKSISSSKYFNIPTLRSLGIADINGLEYLGRVERPLGAYAKMSELSRGKDTTVGHWEIAGIVTPKPFPTFPNGFPNELIRRFEDATHRKVICNKPYSGTDVIHDYGQEHIETGALIVYTSADSVFQIAAHEDIVPNDELYGYCKVARELLCKEYAVGRVIARPFEGAFPNFKRTSRRHDFSLEPPAMTMLDALADASLDVISVGKISDIFAHRGLTQEYATGSDIEGMEITHALLKRDFRGLCFTNLVEFDSVYGHRNDTDGYARHLTEIDGMLAEFLHDMRDDDILIISADHGCDPADVSTDHTREYTPMLIYGKDIRPCDLGIRNSFADIAATICELFGVDYDTVGESFAHRITQE